MSEYGPRGPMSEENLFEQGGDALARAGSSEPVLDTPREGMPGSIIDSLHRQEAEAYLEGDDVAQALIGLALDEIVE